MKEFERYCTEEQIRLAYSLGAQLDLLDPENSNGVIIDDKCFAIPTIQQMKSWLRTKGIYIIVDEMPDGNIYSWIVVEIESDNVIDGRSFEYNDAYEDAISAALQGLKNTKI